MNLLTTVILLLGLAGLPAVGWGAKLKEGSDPKGEPSSGVGLVFQFGHVQYPQYDLGSSILFANRSQSFALAGEKFTTTRYGKWGLGLTAGFTTATGVSVGSAEASIFTYPVGAYAIYQLQFMPGQIFVPYFRGGITFTWVRQVSTTGASQPEAGNFSAHYVIGFALLLDSIEPKYAASLQEDTGINDTYLTFEFENGSKLGPNARPNTTLIAYRIGLRFEF